MLAVGLTINSSHIVGSSLVTIQYSSCAKAHLMLMSEVYFIHRLHFPLSILDIGKAAFSAAPSVDRDSIILR